MNLILASTSKYRQAQLEKLAFPFSAHAPDFDEGPLKKEGHTPYELSRLLAKGKAESLRPRFPGDIIIGSDQVAHLNDQLLSKPGGFERAHSQLMLMKGQKHTLTTSVALIGPAGLEVIFTNQTHLTMRDLSAREIELYLKRDTPYDCAGSYKIESYGIGLFDKIETEDFSAIIGLPLLELGRELRKHFAVL